MENNNDNQQNIDTTLEELKKSKDIITFSVGQDYKEGKLLYGFLSNEESYVVTSNYEVVKLSDMESELDLKPNTNAVESSRLDIKHIIDDIEKKQKLILPTTNIFDNLVRYYKDYIFFDDERTYDVLAIWTMYTYIYKAFPYCPYIWLNADKGSGKTLLLELLQNFCFNAQMITNCTPASIFRYVEVSNATLLIDEFENIMNDNNDELRTVLNSGFKSDAKVSRLVANKDDYKTKFFSAYSPKAFAGINDIGDVLRDRCIVIRLLKMPKYAQVKRFKKTKELSKKIYSYINSLYLFGLTHCNEIKEIYDSNEVQAPDELSYRDKDIWEPLLCIARFLDNNEYEIDTYEYNIEDRLRSYAVDKSKERSIADTEDNLSYKLIKDLLEIVNENKIEPANVNDKTIYNNDILLNYLTNECDYLFNSTQSLTKTLKNKLDIQSERYTINGNKYRGYVFDKDKITDLAERYNIL